MKILRTTFWALMLTLGSVKINHIAGTTHH